MDFTITKKISISYSFFLILFTCLFTGYLLYYIGALIILFLHECGHLFFIKLFKYEIKNIRLFAFGAIIEYDENINDKNYKRLLISAGGIIINIIIFIALFFTPFTYLKLANFSILLFNLIPIFPLDGSRMITSILSYIFKYKNVLYLITILSFVSIILMLIINIISIKSLYVYFLVTYFCIENIKFYKNIYERYFDFLKNKYYNPNLELGIKVSKKWYKNDGDNLYLGYNNLIKKGQNLITEKSILDDLFKAVV